MRQWLWERGHGPLFPAELTVHDDGIGGRPLVTGPFETEIAVAVACTDRVGVALARPAPEPAGIAIEPLCAADVAESVRRATRAATAAAGPGGPPVPVETRCLEGHVVAWTAQDRTGPG